MISSRFSLLLYLPLAILISSQLVFLNGNLPQDDYLASSEQAVAGFSGQDESKSPDAGLGVDVHGNARIEYSESVLFDLAHALQRVPLEFRATGPPNS